MQNKDGDKIAGEILESFIAGDFEPFDNVSFEIPFHEQIIEELACIKGIKLFEDLRTNSGAVVGIKGSNRKWPK